MRGKEKTALDAATSESGDENKTFDESIVSNSDFITAVGTGQGRIESLPAEGEQGQREISYFVRTLDARARNTFRTLRAARAALQVIPGQMEVNNGFETDV